MNERIHLFPVLVLTLFATASCLTQQQEKPAVNLIFETDMGNDVDDALALDMIFKYLDEGCINLLAIGTNKPEPESAEMIDIMRTWYGYPDIPLGVVKRDGIWDTNVDFPFARRVAGLKKADGTPKYERTCPDVDSLPETCRLYRKVLAEAKDHSVVIASVGFTTNLAQLLDTDADEYSPLSGRDLVARKVSLLSIMGGFFADTVTLEFNVTRDIPSSRKVFEEWPTPMVLSPAELGLNVMYPGMRIQDDFYWANGNHPAVDAYINYFGPSYDRPCWDLTSVLFAVEGGDYFNISESGSISINEKGITRFTPDETGKARILSADDAQAQRMQDRFVELTHQIPAAWLRKYPYKNPSLSPSQRAQDLLPRLSLEQKVSLMQNDSPAIPELGIRKYNWWSEALHGVAADGLATVFPQNIGMAASFDTSLVRQCFDVVSTEQRVKFTRHREEGQTDIFQGLTVWAPNVNLFRDPRWGRGQETYGEDPFLVSLMGAATVQGLQGDTREAQYDKLHASLKHYAVHSGPESLRHRFDVDSLSYRDLRESYLQAFEYLVRNTDVKEVMCAYNRFEGSPCCGSDKLLTRILRDEWGFKGLVVSDCWAINNFFQEGQHNLFPDDPVSATAYAVMSGTDLECGSSFQHLLQAVAEGKMDESTIDTSLMRLLTARFELGEMDSEALVPWNRIPFDTLACPSHHDLSYRMSLETLTLLQNNGVLPLPESGIRVAVIGPNAADERVLWGNYNGIPRHTETVLDAVRSLLGPDQVVYSPYCDIAPLSRTADHTLSTTNPELYSRQVAAEKMPARECLSRSQLDAEDVDAYIFVGGISPLLEGEEMPVQQEGFLGGDRTTIELPSTQRIALAELQKKGKPVIFVNMSGSAMGLEPETKSCDAILQAWYGGEAGGRAIAEVLFGRYNPGGKLPVTFYRSDADLPDFEDYNMEDRTYRYFKGTPLFPFGFGLSYTRFHYGQATVSKGCHSIQIPVTNIGSRDGHETVQLYIRRDDDPSGPTRSLRGFRKVFVKAGETAIVEIPLDEFTFRLYNERNGKLEAVPGKYALFYGGSSAPQDLKQISLEYK